MKLYTNKIDFLESVELGNYDVCLFEYTEAPSDELAIQGLDSLKRKAIRHDALPSLLGKMTDSTGKSKYLFYYSQEFLFDENLISYVICEFRCNKHGKVIATFGRLFHEIIEQSYNVQGNDYDIYQLIYVYKSFSMFDDLPFTDFLESPHFDECILISDLLNY
ncbi:hypothetical protein ABEH28_13130 [Pseudomonas sp. Ps21-P2]|uniref:hypothetical protein n=1 Tax=Pseudomonas sp. Ps21-P2 TaxID=3080331 RepID=UPI003208E9AC